MGIVDENGLRIGEYYFPVDKQLEKYNKIRIPFNHAELNYRQNMKESFSRKVHCFRDVYDKAGNCFQELFERSINLGVEVVNEVTDLYWDKDQFKDKFIDSGELDKLKKYLYLLKETNDELCEFIKEKESDYWLEINNREKGFFDGNDNSLSLIGTICFGMKGAILGNVVNIMGKAGAVALNGISDMRLSLKAREEIIRRENHLYAMKGDDLLEMYEQAISKVVLDVFLFVHGLCNVHGYPIKTIVFDKNEAERCEKQMIATILNESLPKEEAIKNICCLLEKTPYMPELLIGLAVLDRSLENDVLKFALFFGLDDSVNANSIKESRYTFQAKRFSRKIPARSVLPPMTCWMTTKDSPVISVTHLSVMTVTSGSAVISCCVLNGHSINHPEHNQNDENSNHSSWYATEQYQPPGPGQFLFQHQSGIRENHQCPTADEGPSGK